MTEDFNQSDPYRVKAAWESMMNAIEGISAGQKWADKFIAKILQFIAISLGDKSHCEDEG